jgi:peptide/nickel transport system ATP-binding protein
MALLDVHDLGVTFPTPYGLVEAVRGISFSVDRGRTLAIVGESGSGKTVTAQTILGLTQGARIRGRVLFDGSDLLRMKARQLRAVRGAQISMIFQNPHSSLHPCHRIGAQIAEAIRLHDPMSVRAARARALELLRLVGIPNAERRAHDFPHEFSGGMLQRAMIAMAVALNPRLVIADEPTTALDVTVQAQILRLLRSLRDEFGMALLLITHDLGVVAAMADEVMVMYAGRIMERASRHTLYRAPHHPYTKGLLRSQTRADRAGTRLTPIPGQPPVLIEPPEGCPFHPRCDYVEERCHRDQPLVAVPGDSEHRSACWLPGGRPA